MPQTAGPCAERPRRRGKPEGRASLTARIWSSIAVIVELPCLPRSAEGPAEGLAPAQLLEPMKEGAHDRDTLASDGSRTVPGAPVEPAQFTTLFLAHGLPARRPHCASPQKTVSPGRWSRSRRALPPVKLWPAMDLGPTKVVPGACESSDFSSRARPPRAPRHSAP